MQLKTFNKCLNKISKGDSDALSEFYKNFFEKIQTLAYVEVNNYSAARTIAALFIKNLQNNTKELRIENPSIWIYKTVKALSQTYLKKRTVAPDTDVNSNDVIIETIKHLPHEEQELFALAFVAEFNAVEISKLKNKPFAEVCRKIFEVHDKTRQIM